MNRCIQQNLGALPRRAELGSILTCGFDVHQVLSREAPIVTTPSRFLKPKKTLPNTKVQNREENSPPIYEKESEFIERPILIAGTKGKIKAFTSDTGELLWNYQSPGGWSNVPVIIVEPPSLEHGRPYQLIYVGSGKHVCCLRALTGELAWTSKVCDARLFGLGSMTLATPWSSRLAAEAYTAFSQNPLDDHN